MQPDCNPDQVDKATEHRPARRALLRHLRGLSGCFGADDVSTKAAPNLARSMDPGRGQSHGYTFRDRARSQLPTTTTRRRHLPLVRTGLRSSPRVDHGGGVRGRQAPVPRVLADRWRTLHGHPAAMTQGRSPHARLQTRSLNRPLRAPRTSAPLRTTNQGCRQGRLPSGRPAGSWRSGPSTSP
jgi:hypothetical protein